MMDTGYSRTSDYRRDNGGGYTIDLDTGSTGAAGAGSAGVSPAAMATTGAASAAPVTSAPVESQRFAGAYTPSSSGQSSVDALIAGLLSQGAGAMSNRKSSWYDGAGEGKPATGGASQQSADLVGQMATMIAKNPNAFGGSKSDAAGKAATTSGASATAAGASGAATSAAGAATKTLMA